MPVYQPSCTLTSAIVTQVARIADAVGPLPATLSEQAFVEWVSECASECALRKLREAGHLQRIGPAKGGYWKVLDANISREHH